MSTNDFGMSQTRYHQLNSKESGQLTAEEMERGWHFCPDWDFLLTNNHDPEGEHCTCPDWTQQEVEVVREAQIAAVVKAAL